MTTSFVRFVVVHGGLKRQILPILIALLVFLITSCINSHGLMFYENEHGTVCARFGLMKVGKTRGVGFKFEGSGLDGTCKPKKIKAYQPIGKY